MVDRKKRRYSLVEDTLVSEDCSGRKTPRHSPEQTSAPVVIRAENSPARSFKERSMSMLRSVSEFWTGKGSNNEKRKSAQPEQTNGDPITDHDHLHNGYASPVQMKEVSRLENRQLVNGHLNDWQIISNGDAGPSTRSRTRSRSPNPTTPKVYLRQALMSASPPDSEHLVIPTSTQQSTFDSSSLDGPSGSIQPSIFSTQAPSTLSTDPEPSRTSQLSSTLSTQPGSTSSTQPTSILPTQSALSSHLSQTSSSQPLDTQSPLTEAAEDRVTSSGSTSGQASDPPYAEDDGEAGEGTEDQPIELGDSDNEEEEEEAIEAGPSVPIIQATSSRTSKRAPPSRPDLTGHKVERDYGWMPPPLDPSSRVAPATPPITRSRAQTPTPRTRRRTGDAVAKKKQRGQIVASRIRSTVKEMTLMGEKVTSQFTKAAGRVAKDFKQPKVGGRREPQGARHEKDYQRQSVLLSGAASKKILGDMLNFGKTADEVILSQPEQPFSPSQSRRVVAESKSAERRRATIEDIIESFERQQLERELDIKERLYPKAPTKMSDARVKQVRSHLTNPSFKVEHLTAEVKAASLSRLKDGQWLDDEIINYYGSMIQARCDRVHGPKKAAKGDTGKDTILNVHYFNSFFYKKLSEDGYNGSRLKRWTKKFDIFAKDLVIFPINLGNMHWTVGAINMKEKRLEYYDSMSEYTGKGDAIFRELFEYLSAEHQDKKGAPFDESGWTTQYSIKTPQQNNGSDCGVFSCQTLETLSRGKDLFNIDNFEFGHDNMEYIRKLMVLEIAQGKLEPRWPKET